MKVRFRFKDGIYGEVKDIEFAIESMTQDNWREKQRAIEHRIESLSRTSGLEEEVKHLYFLLKEKVNSFNVRKIEDGGADVEVEKIIKEALEEIGQANSIKHFTTRGQGYTIDFVDFTLSDKGRFFKIVEPKLGELGWDIGDFGRFANMAKRPTNDSFIEDADEMELTEEELKELFLQFDLSGINEALSERLGFEVNLKAYVEEKPRVNRYSLYDETDHSKDTSFTDMLFTKLTIGTFSGGWSKVNSYFWFGIDIFYSVHGGGSNGVKFAELEMYPDGEYNLTFNKDKYK